MKHKENHVEIEELSLPVDSVNLETVLPMIDYTDIHTIFIKEERKQITKRNVEEWPDLEKVAKEVISLSNSLNIKLYIFYDRLLNL